MTEAHIVWEGQDLFRVTDPALRTAVNARLGGEICKPSTLTHALGVGNVTKDGERHVLPVLRVGKIAFTSVDAVLGYFQMLSERDAAEVAAR